MTNDGTEPRRGGSALAWALAVAVAVIANYLAFLGWHQEKETDPATGAQTGPYQPWQVVGVGIGLIIVAFIAGRYGRAKLVTAVLPLTLTACFALDAATEPDADGLWVIGAALVAVGSLLGTAAVAALATRSRHRRGPSRRR